MSEFEIKDSGQRQQFDSGMVRDTTEGKIDYHRVFDGPMLERWAVHLTKGATKYPDVRPGVANWTLADGPAELARFKASALRHFVQWFRGDTDEDHAAAIMFNVNGAEYVRGRKEKSPKEQFTPEPMARPEAAMPTSYKDRCLTPEYAMLVRTLGIAEAEAWAREYDLP